MPVALAIAAGGALGALARYGVDRFVSTRTVSVFPWGTFVVNVSGCLAVGFLIGAFVDRHHAPAWLRAALVVGFCGAYTTFSTFAQETTNLVDARDYGLAFANVALSVLAGIAAVLLGQAAGRLV
jgi:CrcB protein